MPKMPMPESRSWTILQLVKWTTGYFQRHALDRARSEAEILLAHSLGMRRIDLYLNHDKPLGKDELSRFKALIKRRVKREPLAYITGAREFWSLTLAVNPSVLIPRPETECLVEVVLPVLDNTGGSTKRVLDLGTGSGAVVIALAHERPEHRYVATDRSLAALQTARENACSHQVNHRIDWFCGCWEQALAPDRGIFDLIVSNPPYIRSHDLNNLQPEIRNHEPSMALDGDEDGLACLRRIIVTACRFLRIGGMLAIEMGCDQANDVLTIARQVGCYDTPRIYKDYSGHDRVAVVKNMQGRRNPAKDE